MIGWAIAIGAAHFASRRDVRAAAVIGALVVSHWLLDALVHAPDLPLAPGGSARVGFGLWNLPLIELGVELLICAAGVWVYARTTAPRDAIGRWGLISLVAFLALIQFGNAFGAPPPSVAAIAWVGQAQWLLVLWAYWLDRHRRVRGTGIATLTRARIA